MRITKDLSGQDFDAEKISINSKEIDGKNDIFIAINTRGHEFVKEAIERGAIAAIIDNKAYEIPGKTVLVENTLEFLKNIGLKAKKKANLKITVGITGSTGKTTTKTWLNHVLSKGGFKSFASLRNYNTIYGLPISLSLMDEHTNFGIFEMGSNHPGEISELSKYIKPQIGIITNIYESHIGKFGSKEAIANEKISIIDGITKSDNCESTLLYDGDSEFKDKIISSARNRISNLFSVGFSRGCDFRITSYERETIEVDTPLGKVSYGFKIPGKHYAYITGMIIAVLHAMKFDIRNFLGYFKDLAPIEGRGQRETYDIQGKRLEIIDDSYNASPSAMLASLQAFSSNKNKVAIIGQMGELGSYEEFYHRMVFDKLNSMDLDQVFFIGDPKLWDTVNPNGKVTCFEKLDDLAVEKILGMIYNGSVVLLKGSHFVGLKRFIDYVERCSTI